MRFSVTAVTLGAILLTCVRQVTSAVNESSVRIYGVTADGFSVEFDPAVAIVGNYTIRYSTGGAVNNISWPDASVRITGVNPIQNDYLVSISDDGGVTFTRDFSTKIWNVGETSENSLAFSWDPWPDTVAFYSASIQENVLVNSTFDVVSPNATFNGLSPGVIYTVLVTFNDFGVTDTLLFEITQITRSSAPQASFVSQTSTELTVNWTTVAGADSYTTQLLAFPSRVVVSGIGGVGGTNANNVTLTNLIDGVPYILEVCSVNNAGLSCLDFIVSGVMPMAAILDITEVSSNTVQVSFTSAPASTMYNVIVTSESGTFLQNVTSVTASVLVTNLTPGTYYYFTVEVIYPAGTSEASSPILHMKADGACSSGLTITQDNSGMNGTITSPNYPGNYSNNLTCTWTIQAPTDKVIEVRFVDFELETCFPFLAYYDFLNVFDGEIQEYFMLCGDNVPPTFVSTFGQVRFQFETDWIGTARGFRIEWKFVDITNIDVEPTCGTQNCSLHASCVNGTCECDPGFTGNATSSCDDVNECLDTVSICGSNALCTNAIGSFRCICIAGTTLASGSCMPIFCPEELLWYQNTSNILVMFPQTKAGRSSESLNVCPPNTANAGVPYGNRACSLDGTWLAPKWLTSCERNAQSYINQTFNSTMERQEAANDLELFTLQAQNFTADNVTTTVQALENVINAETLDQNTSSSAVATVGNLLTVSRDELEQSGQATNLFQILDSVGERVEVNAGEEFQEVSSTLAVAVVQPDPTSAEQGIGYSFRSLPFADDVGFRSDQFNTFTRSPREDASSFIQLPRDALMRSQDNRASFYAFFDDTFFRASSTSYGNSSNEFIGSELIFSATVVNATKMINFEDPVVMRFAFTSNVSESNNFQKMCVFWNETGGGFWSSEGLVRQTITSNTAECQFNHLTNFATLFSTGSVDIPGLDLVSIIGSSVSIFCLVGLLITFAFVKKLRVGAKFRSAFLLINLSFALLFLNITLIISENIEKMSEGCKVIAVFIHFSLLASLSWMMVEGAVIYVTVVHGLYARANITNRQVVTSSMLWGWLMPAVVVSIVVGVDINNYSRNDAECWLRKDLVNFLSTIPAAIILAINLILYLATLTFLIRRRRPTGAKKSDVRKNVILSVTLFVTIGGSWLFGLAIPSTETYSKNASIVFAYIFTILNAFQGFFLFLLYVVRQYFTANLFIPFIKKVITSFPDTQSSKVLSTTQNDSAKGAI
ncbi:adhesion G protein-coupled receptor L4-like isoform X2 [Clavelina lepadiformis]|uniref:adhesion G protein-coupled receptor L4-like isoform X2 n=1 Tax=Clavelina lepadiformis TaxID=159417 RepID=UPI00404271FC